MTDVPRVPYAVVECRYQCQIADRVPHVGRLEPTNTRWAARRRILGDQTVEGHHDRGCGLLPRVPYADIESPSQCQIADRAPHAGGLEPAQLTNTNTWQHAGAAP